MSGGHWLYAGFRIMDRMEQIGNDPEVVGRWPAVAGIFRSLAVIVYKLEHDMDWDLSGDSGIADDAAFDRQSAGAFLDVVLKSLPDELFERGKWATIQAWQQRTGAEESRGFLSDIPVPQGKEEVDHD